MMKYNEKKIFDYWVVLWIILFSGSLYFQIQRIRLSMVIIMVTTIILFLRTRKIDKRNFKIVVIIVSIIIFNTVINLTNGVDINLGILMLVKIVFLLVVQSNMSFSDFKKKFVLLMFIEAIVSLFCFLWVDVLAISALPLQHWEAGANNGYYLTPYYTIGWSNVPVFGRNAGLFNEPGSHQIFLNLALLFLLDDTKRSGLSKTKFTFVFITIIIAVLTTMSTTGYLSLFLILTIYIFIQNNSANSIFEKTRKRQIIFLVLVAFVALIIIESSSGIVEDKLSGGGSYRTRENDTSIGYQIAASKPFFGYGLLSTNTSIMLSNYGIVNISNGMASFFIKSGYIFGLLLLFVTYNGMRKKFNRGYLYSLFAFFFYLMCINSEGGMLNPIYLQFMFYWRMNQGELINEKVRTNLLKYNDD